MYFYFKRYQVECESEHIRFTLTDPDDLIEWVKTINEASKSLKRRSATLKKPSSNARPIRKEQIKNILKENKRGTKRAATPLESPTPTPGKLRRFLNISDRLDELVNYLSPARHSPGANSRQTTSSSMQVKTRFYIN